MKKKFSLIILISSLYLSIFSSSLSNRLEAYDVENHINYYSENKNNNKKNEKINNKKSSLFTYYAPSVEFRFLPGTLWNSGFLDIMVPLVQKPNLNAFINVRSRRDSNGSQEGNIGFGYRKIINQKMILGCYGYLDFCKSGLKNYFIQSMIGLESLNIGNLLDLRANFYLPENGLKPTNYNRTVELAGRFINKLSTYEVALPGFDADLFIWLPAAPGLNNLRAGLGIGAYRYFKEKFPSASGIRSRAEIQLSDLFNYNSRLTLAVEFTTSKLHLTKTVGLFGLRIPLSCEDKEQTIIDRDKFYSHQSRLTDPVARDINIRLNLAYQRTGKVFIDKSTKETPVLIYANPDSPNDGDGKSINSPLNKWSDVIKLVNLNSGSTVIAFQDKEDSKFIINETIPIKSSNVRFYGSGTYLIEDLEDGTYTLKVPGYTPNLTDQDEKDYKSYQDLLGELRFSLKSKFYEFLKKNRIVFFSSSPTSSVHIRGFNAILTRYYTSVFDNNVYNNNQLDLPRRKVIEYTFGKINIRDIQGNLKRDGYINWPVFCFGSSNQNWTKIYLRDINFNSNAQNTLIKFNLLNGSKGTLDLQEVKSTNYSNKDKAIDIEVGELDCSKESSIGANLALYDSKSHYKYHTNVYHINQRPTVNNNRKKHNILIDIDNCIYENSLQDTLFYNRGKYHFNQEDKERSGSCVKSIFSIQNSLFIDSLDYKASLKDKIFANPERTFFNMSTYSGRGSHFQDIGVFLTKNKFIINGQNSELVSALNLGVQNHDLGFGGEPNPSKAYIFLKDLTFFANYGEEEYGIDRLIKFQTAFTYSKNLYSTCSSQEALCLNLDNVKTSGPIHAIFSLSSNPHKSLPYPIVVIDISEGNSKLETSYPTGLILSAARPFNFKNDSDWDWLHKTYKTPRQRDRGYLAIEFLAPPFRDLEGDEEPISIEFKYHGIFPQIPPMELASQFLGKLWY